MPTGQIRYRSADTGRPKQKQMADARMVDAVFQPSKKSKADVAARNYKETKAAAAKLKAMDKKKADEKAEKQRKLKERQRKLRAKRRR